MIVFALIPFYRMSKHMGRPQTISFGVNAGITLAVITMFASMTHAFVEAPGIGLGAQIAARLERRSARQPATTAL